MKQFGAYLTVHNYHSWDIFLIISINLWAALTKTLRSRNLIWRPSLLSLCRCLHHQLCRCCYSHFDLRSKWQYETETSEAQCNTFFCRHQTGHKVALSRMVLDKKLYHEKCILSTMSIMSAMTMCEIIYVPSITEFSDTIKVTRTL